jgi:hypothetical protein
MGAGGCLQDMNLSEFFANARDGPTFRRPNVSIDAARSCDDCGRSSIMRHRYSVDAESRRDVGIVATLGGDEMPKTVRGVVDACV